MQVLHVNWTNGALHLWGEEANSLERVHSEAPTPSEEGVCPHPYSIASDALRDIVSAIAPSVALEESQFEISLPSFSRHPAPSPKMAHAVGLVATDDQETEPIGLSTWRIPSLSISALDTPMFLEILEECLQSDLEHLDSPLAPGPSIQYLAAGSRLARALIAEQRVVPMLLQEAGGRLRADWRPWFSDEQTTARVSELLLAMPPIVRAVNDDLEHDPWNVLESFMVRVVDASCRAALIAEGMEEAVEDRDPASDEHVAWLSGLLGGSDDAPAPEQGRPQMLMRVREWIGRLDERGESVEWSLCLTLEEPLVTEDSGPFNAASSEQTWRLSFGLKSVEGEGVQISADEIWLASADTIAVDGRSISDPKHLLLGELARAARIFKRLEKAIEDSEPSELELTTQQAYEFLREIRPLLIEQGFAVEAPEWWGASSARIGARLQIDSPDEAPGEDSGQGSGDSGVGRFGLETLVDYRWRIAVGDTTLTLAEFEKLAALKQPLVRVEGKWVEIRPEDVGAAVEFLRENPGGTVSVLDALRLAYTSDPEKTGLPILGMRATGWVQNIFGGDGTDRPLPMLEQPENFKGSLRPYQVKGLSWLAFLDQFDLGACLADDMGLGKTIQLLALLLHERNEAQRVGADSVAPTLVVAPMSVVGNWQREAARFAPELSTMVHHGVDRLTGGAFEQKAGSSNMVVTTYALAHRDIEALRAIPWRRVVLDEAQNIKNPAAKQTQSLRSLPTNKRVALTGTPVENRLSELWSIMEFCNPGYLGTAGEFRRRFSVPIERRHDKHRSSQLRSLVRPFVLRRLKTDPTITADLPDKVETKEFCPLTQEQATLYEAAVKRMLSEVDDTEGMKRRGMVLATLIKLKQICNHPSQLLRDHQRDATGAVSAERSGKCVRLLEMLEELVSAGDQALVFTQFRQMGSLLAPMIAQHLDRDVLFLHGGVSKLKREQMVDRFQHRDGSAPVFILSLRAGGVGMNLTAASHVFHFDRWWNPAVENQATDRAHRIGQTRTVQVHKFIVAGTLEERIDEMIEQKTELSERIITSGERWLTELSTNQLKDLLTLRPDAVELQEA